MKKEKDYAWLLVVIIFIIAALASCSVPNKVIAGNITYIKGNNVCIGNDCFKVYGGEDSLYLGKWVSFTSTVNRSKINSKKLR